MMHPPIFQAAVPVADVTTSSGAREPHPARTYVASQTAEDAVDVACRPPARIKMRTVNFGQVHSAPAACCCYALWPRTSMLKAAGAMAALTFYQNSSWGVVVIVVADMLIEIRWSWSESRLMFPAGKQPDRRHRRGRDHADVAQIPSKRADGRHAHLPLPQHAQLPPRRSGAPW